MVDCQVVDDSRVYLVETVQPLAPFTPKGLYTVKNLTLCSLSYLVWL